MKEDVNLINFSSLLHPFQGTLLTTMGTDIGKDGEHKEASKPNIIAIAWIMPVSTTPPALVFAIRKERYSYKLLKENGEFAVNIVTRNLKDAVFYCGTKSGKNCDKFKETGLTPEKAKFIKVPIIKECIAHIECSVRGIIDEGLDHVLVIGNVISAYADSEYFDKHWKTKKINLLLHLGGDVFTTNENSEFKATPKSSS